MTNDFKKTLGENTEQLETKIKEFAPYYINQKVNQKLTQKEKELEEKILRQMAFYKRLRE